MAFSGGRLMSIFVIVALGAFYSVLVINGRQPTKMLFPVTRKAAVLNKPHLAPILEVTAQPSISDVTTKPSNLEVKRKPSSSEVSRKPSRSHPHHTSPCPDRVERTRRACERWNLLPTQQNNPRVNKYLNKIYVDEEHKVIYCAIKKVGCSTFKLLIAQANRKVDKEYKPSDQINSVAVLRAAGLRVLQSYSDEEIEYRLKSYKKFVVVRHPFDRLLSAYGQKFSEFATDHNVVKRNMPLIKQMIPGFQLNGTNPNISPQQFLEMVANNFINGHWAPFYGQCNPCQIPFDSIVKLETLDTDIKEILGWLNVTKFPLVNRSRNMTAEAKLQQVTKIFNSLDPQIRQKLRDKYSMDFELFGYEYDKHGASCAYANVTGGPECC